MHSKRLSLGSKRQRGQTMCSALTRSDESCSRVSCLSSSSSLGHTSCHVSALQAGHRGTAYSSGIAPTSCSKHTICGSMVQTEGCVHAIIASTYWVMTATDQASSGALRLPYCVHSAAASFDRPYAAVPGKCEVFCEVLWWYLAHGLS